MISFLSVSPPLFFLQLKTKQTNVVQDLPTLLPLEILNDNKPALFFSNDSLSNTETCEMNIGHFKMVFIENGSTLKFILKYHHHHYCRLES